MVNVQVTSQETLKPSFPTPDHLRYLQVSLIDQLNSPFFVPTIYFFRRPKNTTPQETSTFLQKLKTSLSTALSIYYPLAGRLHNADYVACNDEGVPYIHAKVQSTDLADVAHKLQISDLDRLMPSYEHKGFPRLLLAVQVNSFSCGGIVVALKTNHRVVDGFGLLMFLNAWADITNGKDPNLLPRPYFDTWKLFPPQHNPIIEDVLDNPNPNILFDKPVAKWFMFSREKLEDLRSKLCHSSKYLKNLPSVNIVLSAFIWSRIIIACKTIRTTNQIPYEVFVPVSIRHKVSTPDDDSFYFGNFIINAIAKPSCTLGGGGGGGEEPLCCDFIEKVQESIAKLQNDGDFVKNIKEGKQDVRVVSDQFERVKRGQIRAFGFSYVPSLPVHEPDFGWGNPVWAMTGTMVDGLILFTRAGPYSKDVIVTINLSGDDMIKLEADQIFNSLVFKKATLISHSKI